MLAWRASPALRERVRKLGEEHGCSPVALPHAHAWLGIRAPCKKFSSEQLQIEWPDLSLRVELDERCSLSCWAPTQRSLYVHEADDGAVLASSSLPLLVRLCNAQLSTRGLAACLLVMGLPQRVPYARIERVVANQRWSYGGQGARRVEALPSELVDAEVTTHALACEQLSGALGAAVDRAAAGTGKIGVLLSGGLDSSAVLAALAERVAVDRIVAITWKLDERSADTPYVDAWQTRLGLKVETVSADDAAPLLASSLVVGGAPTALMTAAFERVAMRRAREQGATVLLTGVGGDETFSGSLQAAVRSRATLVQSLRRAVLAELPWGSSAAERVSHLVLRPLLRPLLPRRLRERTFVSRARAELPELGAVPSALLRVAAQLHVGALPRVPTTAQERFREMTERPFWLEMGELRAQLEHAEGVTRFDIPLDRELHRAVAAISPELLFCEDRHRGLLRRVLQSRAPQIVTARFDKADFDAFGQRMLQRSNMLAPLRSLAQGTQLGRLGLVPTGAIARRWGPRPGFPDDLTTFLGWWPFLTAEAFAREHS